MSDVVDISSPGYLLNLKFRSQQEVDDFIKRYSVSKLTKCHGDKIKEAPQYKRVSLQCECAGIFTSRGTGARRILSKKCGCGFTIDLKMNKQQNELYVDAETSSFIHNDACQMYQAKKSSTSQGNHHAKATPATTAPLASKDRDLVALTNDEVENPVKRKDNEAITEPGVGSDDERESIRNLNLSPWGPYEDIDSNTHSQCTKSVSDEDIHDPCVKSSSVEDSATAGEISCSLKKISMSPSGSTNTEIIEPEEPKQKPKGNKKGMVIVSMSAKTITDEMVFDEDALKSKRGRKLHSKKVNTVGATLKPPLSKYEEKSNSNKAIWLLKVWLTELGVVENIIESAYIIKPIDIRNWSQCLADTFFDDAVDINVLSSLICKTSTGEAEEIFSKQILTLLAKQIEAKKMFEVFICLTCRNGDDAGQCTSCLCWYHTSCIKKQKMMFKPGSAAWYCDRCHDLIK